LNHVGDKFVKLVPKMLLTDVIPSDIPGYIQKISFRRHLDKVNMADPTAYLHTVTAEGTAVILDTMVFWRIKDTLKAARNAMEILMVQEN